MPETPSVEDLFERLAQPDELNKPWPAELDVAQERGASCERLGLIKSLSDALFMGDQ